MKKGANIVKAARALLVLAALVLEILPFGAVMKFSLVNESGGIEYIYEAYSYFNMMPFGYAMFFYMICGVLTVICLLLSVLQTVGRGKSQTSHIVLLSIAGVCSVFPYLFGTFNIVTVVITAVLAAALGKSIYLWAKEQRT